MRTWSGRCAASLERMPSRRGSTSLREIPLRDGSSDPSAGYWSPRAGITFSFWCFTPPYHNIIRFTPHERDLSNAPDTDSFLRAFRRVARIGFELLEAGRFAALVIGDKYEDRELVPLGFLTMQEMVKAGFRVKSIVVKNIVGNERGKGKATNLWRYRALAGGFYIFRHEYVIIFQKP